MRIEVTTYEAEIRNEGDLANSTYVFRDYDKAVAFCAKETLMYHVRLALLMVYPTGGHTITQWYMDGKKYDDKTATELERMYFRNRLRNYTCELLDLN